MRWALVHVWRDLRQGENIDSYATIAAALGLAFLNLIGLIPNLTTTISILLAVVALLATSTLVNRYRLERILERISPGSVPQLLEDYPQTLSRDINNARALLLVGLGHMRIIQTHYSAIERIARSGIEVRILVTDPDSDAVKMVASSIWGRREIERVRDEIFVSLKDLCHMLSTGASHLRIRATPQHLTFGLIGINPGDRDGTLYIGHYRYKARSYPKIVLGQSDQPAYRIYLEQAQSLWDDATEWDCTT